MKIIMSVFAVLYLILIFAFVWEVIVFVKTKEEYEIVKAKEREAQRKYNATVQELIDVLNGRHP